MKRSSPGAVFIHHKEGREPYRRSFGGVRSSHCFHLLAIASAMGACRLPFGTLATGWGIPTATDGMVAWVKWLIRCLGRSLTAINFCCCVPLLMMALGWSS